MRVAVNVLVELEVELDVEEECICACGDRLREQAGVAEEEVAKDIQCLIVLTPCSPAPSFLLA